jgi:hypothetical protein
MAWFETSLRYLHVIFGFAGLAAFWIPVLSRKGGPNHIRYGTIFVRCAWVVLVSAFVAVCYHLIKLNLSGVTLADRPQTYAFLVFLGYLALVTWISIRHSIGVLKSKANPAALATPLNLMLGRIAIASSVFLIAFAVWLRPGNMIVLLALSPIGLGTGSGILKYCKSPPVSRHQWLYEHLGGMIGAGIAFHTAFAVFGSRQLFDYNFDGWIGVVPWVLPAAIGIPAITLWTRRYRRQFGELGGEVS